MRGQRMTSIHAFCLVSATMLLPPLTSRENFTREGWEALEKEDYNKAIAVLTKAIKANPKVAENYVGRGYAYLHLDKLDQALADLNAAIQRDPHYASAYAERGSVYGKQQKY